MNQWVKTIDKDNKMPMAFNLGQFSQAFVGDIKDSEDYAVWLRYDTKWSHERIVYRGTQVECLRYFDKLMNCMQPMDFHPWEADETEIMG